MRRTSFNPSTLATESLSATSTRSPSKLQRLRLDGTLGGALPFDGGSGGGGSAGGSGGSGGGSGGLVFDGGLGGSGGGGGSTGGGCNCATGPGAIAWVALALVGVVRRRRS